MHNALLDVSAKAFQKNLEKEAKGQNRGEFDDFGFVEVEEEVEGSTSIFHLLLNWLGDTKQPRPRVVSPKLKNKSV